MSVFCVSVKALICLPCGSHLAMCSLVHLKAFEDFFTSLLSVCLTLMIRTPVYLICTWLSYRWPCVTLHGALLASSNSHTSPMYDLTQLTFLLHIDSGLADCPLWIRFVAWTTTCFGLDPSCP